MSKRERMHRREEGCEFSRSDYDYDGRFPERISQPRRRPPIRDHAAL